MDCKVAEEKQLTIDEAIAHAEERVNDTPCGRQHKQLADWLKELKTLKSVPAMNNAALREALEIVRDAHYVETDNNGDDYEGFCVEADDGTGRPLICVVESALDKPARNCDLLGGDKEKLHAKWWEWSGTKEGTNEDGTVKLTFGEWLLESADKET